MREKIAGFYERKNGHKTFTIKKKKKRKKKRPLEIQTMGSP